MKRPIHASHRMGKPYTDIRAPAGTPRFYGVRVCEDCGAEEIEHAAGQFTDQALSKPCFVNAPAKKVAKPKAAKKVVKPKVRTKKPTKASTKKPTKKARS